MTKLRGILRLLAASAITAYSQNVITTIAGTDVTYSSDPVPANSVSYGSLFGVAVSPITGDVYFTSSSRSLLMKYDHAKNTVAVVAGIGVTGSSGDGGPAVRAALSLPGALVFDPSGNLYIAGQGGGIRKMDMAGVISTFAQPWQSERATGLTLAPNGSFYYTRNNQIFRLDANGVTTLVAGDTQQGYTGDGGPAARALLSLPEQIASDSAGALYFVDQLRTVVRRIGLDGKISTLAGKGQLGEPVVGPAIASPLNLLSGIAVDKSGNVFVGTTGCALLRIDSGGTLSFAHTNTSDVIPAVAVPAEDGYGCPYQMTFDGAGNLYWTDTVARALYRFSAAGTIQALAGYAPNAGIGDNGPALSAVLSDPEGVALMPDGSLLIADTANRRIRRISTSGVITTLPGTSALGTGPHSVVADLNGNVYINGIYKISPTGTVSFNPVSGCCLALDAQGSVLSGDSDHNVVRKTTLDGRSVVFAGNGQGAFSGDGGPATQASLNWPWGVAVCPDGNTYISDLRNQRIRRVNTSGIISTYAGGGPSLRDGVPATQSAIVGGESLACDRQGSLYFGNPNVRRITPDGIVRLFAGSGPAGFSGDGGPALSAAIGKATGLAVDGAGNVYIADALNNRIRKVWADPPPIAVSSSQVSLTGIREGPLVRVNIGVTSPAQGLAYSVKVATASGGNWLSVSAPQGQAPGTIGIVADPVALDPGSYQGTVTLSSPLGSPSVIAIQVILEVSAPLPAKLTLDTQSLTFTFSGAGGQQGTQLRVANQGTGGIPLRVSATTTSGGGWLGVSPEGGTVSATVPLRIVVTASPGALGPGTYGGSISIAGGSQSLLVPVTMTISAATQGILLSQTGLTFTAVAQGGAPLPQNFGILNSGRGSMNWTASVSTLSGGSGWLAIDQASGTVAKPLLDVSLVNVSVNPTGLTPGDYYGRILVSSDLAANSPQSISVVLNVLPFGSTAGPELRPTGLIFIGDTQNNPGSQSVQVGTTSVEATNFGSSPTYLSPGDWLQYLPSNATVGPGRPVKVIVQPDFTKLQPGIQRAAVTLLFTDGTVRTVNVLSVITAPGAGSSANSSDRAASGCTPLSLSILPTALNDSSAAVALLQPATLSVRVVDNCGSPVTSVNGHVDSISSNGDPQVTLVHVGEGNWSGTWQPRNAAAGSRVTVSFFATSVVPGLVLPITGGATITVSLRSGTTAPLTFGASNSASGVGTFISPGGLVSIYGQQLAESTAVSSTPPFPTVVNGTQVLMGGKALPLYYVGIGQINAQVPFDLGINTLQQLVVQRGTTLSVPQDVVVAAAQPAVYTIDSSGHGPGHIYYNGVSLVTPAGPVKAGDVIVLYCNGLGAVTPPVQTGTPSPAAGPLSRTVNTLNVSIGGVNARVDFAGLAPGITGVFQVNAVVPAGVKPGDAVDVVLTIAGQVSPPVTMAVR